MLNPLLNDLAALKPVIYVGKSMRNAARKVKGTARKVKRVMNAANDVKNKAIEPFQNVFSGVGQIVGGFFDIFKGITSKAMLDKSAVFYNGDRNKCDEQIRQGYLKTEEGSVLAKKGLAPCAAIVTLVGLTIIAYSKVTS